MQIKLIVEGGNMKPNATISQKLGPLGINLGKIIADVNSSTKNFSGMKVPIILDIDSKTKAAKVIVGSPSTAALLKKEFNLEKASGQPHKVKVANAAIEQIIKIAISKKSLEKDLKSAVKTVVGSCVSLGILIENKEAKDVENEIDTGNYDKLIKQEASTPSNEKITELAGYFDSIKKKQEEVLKKEAEEKAKAEEEKTAAAAAAPATAAGATGTAGTAAPATEAKKEAKPVAK